MRCDSRGATSLRGGAGCSEIWFRWCDSMYTPNASAPFTRKLKGGRKRASPHALDNSHRGHGLRLTHQSRHMPWSGVPLDWGVCSVPFESSREQAPGVERDGAASSFSLRALRCVLKACRFRPFVVVSRSFLFRSCGRAGGLCAAERRACPLRAARGALPDVARPQNLRKKR